MNLPFVICVSDGVSMRTMHLPMFNPTDQFALRAIIERAINLDARPSPPHTPTRTIKSNPMAEARAAGYEGSPCNHCGEWKMKQSGHCLVCDACGTTTGCS